MTFSGSAKEDQCPSRIGNPASEEKKGFMVF